MRVERQEVREALTAEQTEALLDDWVDAAGCYWLDGDLQEVRRDDLRQLVQAAALQASKDKP